MKVVLQRVSSSNVKVDDVVVGSIEKGILLLVAISHNDDEKIVETMAKKIIQSRIFEDPKRHGAFNLDINEIEGEILVVSQFTLYARTEKGRRPSFVDSAPPEVAKSLIECFVANLKQLTNNKVETGIFGADMKVELINDGPVTLIFEKEN